MSGQASSYYNANQSFGDQPQPQPPQQQQQYAYYNYNQAPQPAPNQHNGGDYRGPEPKPPQGTPQGPPPTYNQAVYGFDEAFQVERPKYNDIWAGLLVG